MSTQEEKVEDALEVARKADQRVSSHEILCEFRYAEIEKGLNKLSKNIEILFERWWIVSGSLVGLLLLIIGALFAQVYGK